MKVDELLEKYSAIELAMIKIDEDKESINKLSQSAKKTFEKQISDIKKIATSKEKDLDILQKRLDEFTETFDEKVTELNDVLESIQNSADEVNESLPDIETQIEGIRKANKDIIKRIKEIETQINASGIELVTSPPTHKPAAKKKSIAIDYQEETTAAKLFAKYDGKIDTPVVIRFENWRNDYCMVIKSVANGYVTGDTYNKGVYVKTEKRRDVKIPLPITSRFRQQEIKFTI